MVRLQDFYTNKKVFLTGHTGFKGAWMAAWLQQLGAIVKGYALPPEYDNGVYDYIRPADSILDDIRNKAALQTAIKEFQPDFIFHLAAQPLVRRSYEIPAETFDVNVTGTANVLEAANNLKCTIVIITTDKVYENKEQDILYKEGDALGGYDPYSASKACAELVVSSFRNSFNNKAIASVRAGNVIGGGDWNKDRIIPDIVRALSNEQVIEVRNPVSVRPWQHVLEPIGGYLQLGALLQQDPAKYAKAYNFGPVAEDHLTVKELVEKAISIWGNGQWKDASKPGQLHEATLLKLDISLAKEELQWRPKLNAAQAIEWTINWYKQPANNRQAYTIQQINEYMQ
ncbi:CDP-glucose 4,6-dehydratase [Chitinophaga sp. YR573]|uniref:CDP-glucose 4,6-dehydratase n=1 Tax=Chitinophaga sp. YR573 TaxID=1881040 RepID=UPI0008BD0AE1|nr:CDP-glucose 4,6-dehydratase [Chitinophaga sp. YR573]SEW44912.1 CDP-glucose 4,6-dehydratase [Chitinophaga sp. YR573]